MAKVESQKISDPDKYMFFDQELKDGVSYINKKYYKVNNEQSRDYNKEKAKN